MSTNYEKLKKLLAELFQLDQAELDFGIYRIMNQKRGEIMQFLDSDLLPQVKEAFTHYQSADKAELQKELEKLIANIESAGMDPDQSPKVKELRSRIADAVDVTALENEVFSDLYSFFRRYYDKGDFISARRYKEGVYAIPYEGEEVKLYWANHDQYYIKTSEYFHNYSFKLPSGKRVCFFKLVEADVEKDNVKAEAGKERRFILSENEPLVESNDELVIRFEYKHDAKKRDQKTLNEEAVKTILEFDSFKDWQQELARLNATEKNPNRTLLEKHLNDYTARNTFDYFIHKDLSKFLRRELDFFIKNEVMHLDDIEDESAPRVEQYLSKIKVIRRIAHKIIEFLAQIEDFQKKLWLKKKFVVETNYCVTLDRVPEALYTEIVKNEAQREEWIRLFAIDEIQGNLHTPAYSNKLTVEFLKANPFLVLDTKFFDQEFKDKLIAGFDNLDEKCDGLLVHSENFQALSLMQKRYKGQVKCSYIDPPYNTGQDGFIYKDSYQHSSWIEMVQDRMIIGTSLLKRDAIHLVSIGDDEFDNLSLLLSGIFPNESIPFVWKSRAKPTNAGDAIYKPQVVAEFVMMNSLDGKLVFHPLKSGEQRTYPHNDEYGRYRTTTILTSNLGRYRRQTMRFEIAGYTPPEEKRWKAGPSEIQSLYENHRIGFGDDGEPHKKIYEGDEKESHIPLWTYMPEDITGTAESGKNDLSSILGSEHGLDSVKPKELIMVFLNAAVLDGIVLDYFAGSGTTADAVITMNREDGKNRHYILVEVEEYFDRLLIPRVQRVIYSKDWKDGKPVSREGSSHMFKYIRLESYEDTLNNLEIRRTETQQSLLEQSSSFRESYMLSYMLDVESRGSLLNVKAFEDPFNYKLNISTGSVGETKPVAVDLVETFNYLIGLTVKHIDDIRGIKVIEGTNPKGQKVLVLWRKVKEMDNDKLDAWFTKQKYNTKDMEYDLIYVNGDNNLENLRREDMTWKVRLIEEEFHRLMFDELEK